MAAPRPTRPHGARTKRARNDASSSSYDAHLFPSRAHSDLFPAFDYLPIDPGRRFDQEVIHFFNLHELPGIQRNNLFQLMRIPASVNEHAVKLFYCNLTDQKDEHGHLGVKLSSGDEVRDRLWTYIYGQEIEITPADICSLIDVPTGGDAHMTGFQGDLFYARVFNVLDVDGDAWRQEHALRAKRMPHDHRVLHLYLSHNYVPRIGRHSSTTFSDLWIMYKLLNGDLINFWDVMVQNFKKVTNGPNRALLRHSRLITLLLQRKGIRFEFPSRTVSSEPYCMSHLTKGDWRRVSEGVYRRREPLSPIHGITLPSDSDDDSDDESDHDGGPAPMAADDPTQSSDPPASQPIAIPPPMPFGGPSTTPPGASSGPSSSTSFADLVHSFDTFTVDITRRFDTFQESVNTSLEAMATQQSQMRSDLDSFFQHFYSLHPRPPPPPPDA